ncbi:MAG TPA: sigma factor-like helix-turn-helix DNA-binding protein [Acidobacteriota bacterium]|nr:sigma factor-like helix-turn-helix DNA-binding protein [Acidobacteriota bacterium]
MAQPVFSLSRHTRHEVFEAIIRSLNAMPENMRKVFVLSHYHDCPAEEIAAKLRLGAEDVAQLLGEANIRFFEGVRSLRLQ